MTMRKVLPVLAAFGVLQLEDWMQIPWFGRS